MNDIKFRAVHFCVAVPYLAVLGWLALVFPEHQAAITITALLPFFLIALLIFTSVFWFRMCYLTDRICEWFTDNLGKLMPRNDIPRRSGTPFRTALQAMISEDKRDLLHFLAAGPSKERYFILRDISDSNLERCMKKLGKNTPQVVVDAWEQRINGTKPKFDRGEEGGVL